MLEKFCKTFCKIKPYLHIMKREVQTMASFKRARLFTNLSSITDENVIYDEVWVYKLVTEQGTTKQKYRIRYQRHDSTVLSYGMTEEETQALDEVMGSLGPAISCTLDVWESKGWVRCLDWMGDPSAPIEVACHELNEQFKAFVTCVPLPKSYNAYSPGPAKPPKDKMYWSPVKNKIKINKEDKPTPNDSADDPDIDWI